VVEVSTAVEKEVINFVSLVGTGQASLETIVASEEAGVVSKMLVEEGDQVTKDQDLCVQDTSQLRLQIEGARAELAEAKILEAQALRDWERQKRLFDINSVSEKAYDDAYFNLNAAKKKTARLQAAYASLLNQLDKSTIKAPVSGYVVERHCLVGQWLGKGNPAVTLVVPDPILFMVSLPERYVPAVNQGDLVEVTFDALPGRIFKGKIDAVIPKADEAARTFPVRIKIPNGDGAVKPGMLGRATLPAGGLHKALLVPKDALVLSGSGKVIFVVIDGTARSVPVKTEAAHGSLIEVKGDLKPGQQVVIRGNERLRPGQAVKVLPSTP
jgi:RND family efflux transporter MFP subunit